MKSICAPSTRAMLLAAAASFGLPAAAVPFELLPIGDSITYGVGSDTDGLASNVSPDDDLGGYRFYLDGLLSSDFDFVGNRSVGSGTSGFADNENFGIRSGEASRDQTFAVDGVDAVSTLSGLYNAGPGVNSADAAYNSSITTPNGILLRIGINSMPKDSFNTPSSAGGAGTRLQGDIALAVDQFQTLLDGDATRPDGMVARLNDTDYFAADAHLFVALITPRLDGDTSSPNSNERYLNRKAGVATAQYNSEIKAAVEAEMGPGGDLEGRVTFVDLFSISLDELDLQALANEFFGGDLAQLEAAISPHDDSLDGGLDYVDWTSVASFDEGEHDNGAFDFNTHIIGTSQDLIDDAGTQNLANANLALLGDGLHPTNLGYAIEAQVWANAINSHYVPEPSALALLFGGGMLLAARRRRRD